MSRKAAESEIADLKEKLRVQQLSIDAMFLTYYVGPIGSRTRKVVRSNIQTRMGLVDPLFKAWEEKTAADITGRNPGGV